MATQHLEKPLVVKPMNQYGLLAYTKDPIERNIPPSVEDLVPDESAAYNRLLELEKKVDVVMSRKRMEIQNMLKQELKSSCVLRVTITHFYQESRGEDVPTWTLKLHGKVIPLDSSQVPKFTAFIRQLTVEMDVNDISAQNDYCFVDYEPKLGGEADVIQIKRAGDRDFPVVIKLRLNYGADRFKVAPELAAILGYPTENVAYLSQTRTKKQIVLDLWKYIKINSLLDRDDRRIVVCDQSLSVIFGVDRVLFPQIPDLINRYLLPPDPVVIPYLIAVEKDQKRVYDFEVEIADKITTDALQELIQSTSEDEAIQAQQTEISKHLFELAELKLKKDFIEEFAADPVTFSQKLSKTHLRDIEEIVGSLNLNMYEHRNSSYYNSPWVKEAIMKYNAMKYR